MPAHKEPCTLLFVITIFCHQPLEVWYDDGSAKTAAFSMRKQLFSFR